MLTAHPSSLADYQDLISARIGLVVSCFNASICEGLLAGAQKVAHDLQMPDSQLIVLRVPGAFEIPLALSWLMKQGHIDAGVALGCVIKGDTPHFDYVCQSVTQGLTQLQLTYGIPVGFGVITTFNEAQAQARSAPDDYNKGKEAFLAVLDMLKLKKGL